MIRPWLGDAGVVEFTLFWSGICDVVVDCFFSFLGDSIHMTGNSNDPNTNRQGGQNPADVPNWGPRLFLGALVAVLAFFYWLLIYSGGVTVHHG